MAVPTAPCRTFNTILNPPALTTTFVPPAKCADSFLYDYWMQPAGLAHRVLLDQLNPVFYECLPEEYDEQNCAQISFSPGICPQDWVALSTSVNEGRTTATCCMRYGVSIFNFSI